MISIGNSIGLKRVCETFQQLGRFSEEDLNLLTHHLKALSIPKDFRLVKEDRVCQSIYFVAHGSFRHYQITDTGKEITQNLYIEKDWVLDYKSFTSQKPSASIIQAMEDSDVLELSIYDLHKLMKTSDVFFQVARIFQFGIEQQETQIQNTTPKERYEFLLAKKPHVIQRFPLKYIASYLGMTPETLSRVRKSLAS
jgi:CRP-like cAMP-binding protein